MRAILALLVLAPALAAQALQRRPLSPPTRSGWASLTLDADATPARGTLWISDADGRPVPHLEVQAGAHLTPATRPGGLRLGRDAAGHPTAAFTVPPGPEGPVLRLEVEAVDRPWIARLRLERPGPGGPWITWDPKPRPHAWDLGAEVAELRVPLPAEPGPWRLTLLPVVGRPPRLTGLAFEARRTAWSLATEARQAVAFRAEAPGRWHLDIPPGEDLRRLEVQLRAPTAPVRPQLLRPQPPVDGKAQEPRLLPAHGALWALPALDSEGTTLTLDTPEDGPLLLQLPEGAEPVAVQAVYARATLAFPAEAGRAYYLHTGGAVRRAPGSLASLASGFDPARAEALRLGAPEADPHGLAPSAKPRTVWDRIAKAWPWLIGALMGALVLAGIRLMKPAP